MGKEAILGKAWKYADDVNTDGIIPAHCLATPSARAQSGFAEPKDRSSRTIRSAYFFSSSR